jgi:hypothetical protein
VKSNNQEASFPKCPVPSVRLIQVSSPAAQHPESLCFRYCEIQSATCVYSYVQIFVGNIILLFCSKKFVYCFSEQYSTVRNIILIYSSRSLRRVSASNYVIR